MRTYISKLGRTFACAALLSALALGGARPAFASDDWDHPALSYVGAGVASLVYFPAKLAFAVGGALTSGVAYAVTLGDRHPSQDIWEASVEGD